MGDIQNRPFSKNYSGLINQSVIALGITVVCVTGQELMKRRRRGKGKDAKDEDGLGSREGWEFGYLYQGRSWARYPSPPSPQGWPLSWVKQAIQFPESEMLRLRGVDATLYIRFMRGCFWFVLLHTFTTFPILFPIHVRFSDDSISPKSMTRASISSLVNTDTGKHLLWIHICLLFWLTLSWVGTLLWICHGAFRLRAENILLLRNRYEASTAAQGIDDDDTYHPHPHPQYPFTDLPVLTGTKPPRGLRWRTIMVSNVPHSLRNEKDLKEYFEYYMTRKLEKPSMGLTSSTQPSIVNKTLAFLFNRAKRIPVSVKVPFLAGETRNSSLDDSEAGHTTASTSRTQESRTAPEIERVVIARKMTELASLLRRREETIANLEAAHIKLAQKTLAAVKCVLESEGSVDGSMKLPTMTTRKRKAIERHRSTGVNVKPGDLERGGTVDGGFEPPEVGDDEARERMEEVVRVMKPFVEEFDLLHESRSTKVGRVFTRSKRYSYSWKQLGEGERESVDVKSPISPTSPTYPPPNTNNGKQKRNSTASHETIWEALYSLPRSTLDHYQPLINLSHLFRGKTVPSIDYYTTKLNLLNSLITEARAKSISDFEPVSSAFVTFKEPRDARRACKYLAVHPNNVLSCVVEMAPMYWDLDWERVMKGTFGGEFVKDWVVDLGVWGFTLFWLFPVSLLVGLVSIQNISLFWPNLKRYLDKHPWEEEVIQSFLPTMAVALLALLIPLILLLIAKKAHTIKTLSALHDRIMTRYYKFLVVNVLVFFCVGTAALQSLLESFRIASGGDQGKERPNVLKIVADSFPTAGPFYVGWLILTTALHGAFEIVLLGLPLIMYPSTSRQVTPRKRAVGIRPRTLNFYYWLPNHLLVIHVLLLFSVLNPFVLPFGSLYFFVQMGVMKNQLVHVYAKNYECNGERILIRIVRYSLDGLILSQAVFLAYMVVLRKEVNVGLAAFLIIATVLTKVFLTRMCRAQFEKDDLEESEVMCNSTPPRGSEMTVPDSSYPAEKNESPVGKPQRSGFASLKMPQWIDFSYKSMHRQPQLRRQPIPFESQDRSFSRLTSMSFDRPRELEPSTAGPHIKRRSRSQSAYEAGRPSRISLGVLDEGRALGDGPVTPHPSAIPWDDNYTIDLPYDNPFYARPFANVLWLPRNPTGVLDLDDTVDLKVSLTVDPTSGRLGNWLGSRPTESPQEIIGADSKSLVASERPTTAHTQKSFMVNGTEDIDLPSTIAMRVERRESDVEQAQQPSKRRPTVYGENSLPRTLRSISSVTERTGSRSLTSMPSFHFSVEHEADDARSFPAPGEAAGPALLHPSHSRMSLASSSHKVSVQNAIIQEVIAEEKAALIDRFEDEQAENAKATKKSRSWFTSWMFRKQE